MKVFDPGIYPRNIYVLDSLDELRYFERRDGVALDIPSDETVDATVWPCVFKDNESYCFAVHFKAKTIETIAHESTHIANGIFQDCQVDFDYLYDEHYAYFVGWIANCIFEALDLKIIKNKKK